MGTILKKFRYGVFGFIGWVLCTSLVVVLGGNVWARFLGLKELGGQGPLGAYELAQHILVCLLFAGSFVLCLDNWRKACFWAGAGLFMALLLPGAGVFLSGAALILVPSVEVGNDDEDLGTDWLHKRKRTRLARKISSLGKTKMDNTRCVQQLMISWVDLTSIDDVLAGDDLMRKRNAIIALARRPSASVVHKLRKLLADSNPDVRFCASSSLLRIETDITKKSSALRNRLRKRGDDPKTRMELAKNYIHEVELGLLPQVTQDQRLQEVSELIASLEPSPERSAVETRIHQFHGDYSKVIKLIENSEVEDPETLFILCDAFLREGRYGELLNTCEQLKRLFWKTGNKQLNDIAQWSAAKMESNNAGA